MVPASGNRSAGTHFAVRNRRHGQGFRNASFLRHFSDTASLKQLTRRQPTCRHVVQHAWIGSFSLSTATTPHMTFTREAIHMHSMTAQTKKPEGRSFHFKSRRQVACRF